MKYASFLLAGLFLILRLSSFGLYGHPLLQAGITLPILGVMIWSGWRDMRNAWYILVTELLLGGAGHTVELMGLSLRTTLLITFCILWLFHLRRSKSRPTIPISGWSRAYFFIFLGTLGLAVIRGFTLHHTATHIIQDILPYSFFLLLPAAHHYLRDWKTQPYYRHLLTAAIWGGAIFTVVTELLFSMGVVVLQDPYYKWFRDGMGGKITDVGDSFFRIVTPEHFLLIPIILVLSACLMTDGKRRALWGLLIMALLPLTFNLSRVYFLGLGVGLFSLLLIYPWRRWLWVSSTTVFIFFVLFSGMHLSLSRGQSLGWNLIGIRLASFAKPSIEESTLSRMLLLPPIWSQITQHPVLGSGLGATVTAVSPRTGLPTTTRHFDWGYLELWTELGILGIISYVLFIILTLKKLSPKMSQTKPLASGLWAGTAALLVMNITSPILFHVLGVSYLVFVVGVMDSL